MSNTKKLILEFDDLHFDHPENCIDDIRYLITKIPNIKLSFFTVPFLRHKAIYENMEFCKELKKYVDSENIRIYHHGLTHSMEEFKHVSYDNAINAINYSLDIFRRAELPCGKVFRGPNWGLNENTVQALIDLNYTHIYNHTSYKNLEIDGIKFCYYNYNLKDEYVDISDNIIIAHGHTHDVCSNGIKQSLNKIENLIIKLDPIFCFAEDV